MVKRSRTPVILGPKAATNLKAEDRTSLLSTDREARDCGDLYKGDLDSDGLLLVWVRAGGGRMLLPFQVK